MKLVGKTALPIFLSTFIHNCTLLLFARVGAFSDHDDCNNPISLPQQHQRRTLRSRTLQSSGISGLVLMYTGVVPSVPVMTLSFDVVNLIDLRTLSLPDSAKFSIDALTALDSKSVVFSNGQCETASPLAYCGNSGYTFNACPNLVLGANVTVTATSFTEKYCGGVAIASRSVSIHIIQTLPPILPTPSIITTVAPVVAPLPLPTSTATIAPLPTKVPTNAPFQAKTQTLAPIPSAPLSGITELVLMYTGVDPSIPIMKLSSDSINIVDLQALSLPYAKFSIDAKIATDTKSVTFSNGQCETAAPLAYCGNVGYTFRPCPDLVLDANVTVTAVAFSEKYGTGVVISQRSVTLHILKSSSVPTTSTIPAATPVATIAPVTSPQTAPTVSHNIASPPQTASIPTGTPRVVPVPTNLVPPVKGCNIPRFTSAWDSNTAHYPIQVAEAQGTMIGRDFIITSGFNGGYTTATPETYALDMWTPNAAWRRMDDMPFPTGLTHLGVAVKGMKAYFCGGYTGGSLGVHNGSCFQYDHSIAPGMGQWTNFSSLPDGGRAGGGMIYDSTIDALVYSAGSHRPTRHVALAIDYQNTWAYSLQHPEAGWVPKADIPFKGNHMNFVTAKDEAGKERHYFFGGQQGDNEETGNTDEVYEYNAVDDVWTLRQSMPFPLGHAAATARAIGCGFIVAGGRLNDGLSKAILYYDIPTNTWTNIGDLTQEIHTNVCVIANGVLRCETGWATGNFSWKRSIAL